MDFLKKGIDSSIPFISQFPIYLGFGWKLIFFLIELQEKAEIKFGKDSEYIPED